MQSAKSSTQLNSPKCPSGAIPTDICSLNCNTYMQSCVIDTGSLLCYNMFTKSRGKL